MVVLSEFARALPSCVRSLPSARWSRRSSTRCAADSISWPSDANGRCWERASLDGCANCCKLGRWLWLEFTKTSLSEVSGLDGRRSLSVITELICSICHVIKVHNFAEAAAIGSDIAGLLVRYEQKSDASFNQVTLRSWQVEITMAVPREGLLPKSQQEFLDAVNACYSSR